MKGIIESVTKPQKKVAEKEMVSIDEETKTDEESAVKIMRSIVKYVADRVKDKKMLKVVTLKSVLNNDEKVK